MKTLVETHRTYYNSGVTRPLPVRLAALNRLAKALGEMEEEFLDALAQDFKKPRSEAYLSEIATSRLELAHTIRELEDWARPREVSRSLGTMLSRARILKEPLGVILVIVPFNYPVLLALSPLIAAVAAGNSVIIKMSRLAPAVTKVLDKLIRRTFRPGHVTILAGGEGVNEAILAQRFDKIMFTGSSASGREILVRAAATLTPVVLELSGKNPVLVLRDADVVIAARKIVWGKFLNAGQTCIAPDHVFVHREVRTAFLEELKRSIAQFFGEDPRTSESFGRLASIEKFRNVRALLEGDLRIEAGGTSDESDRYIAPTLVTDVPADHPLMQEEIFGPILPVQEYTDINEVIACLRQKEKPLAAYVFSQDTDFALKVLQRIPSGGGGVNEVLFQAGSPELPFGGVGNSGMGAYHGQAGFDSFSHTRSVILAPPNLSLPFIYPPYDKLKHNFIRAFLKKLI